MIRLKVYDGSLLFFALGLLFVGISLLISSSALPFELQILITQYLIIALPPIVYLKWKNINIRKALRIRKLSLRDGVYVVLITLLIYPIAVLLNTLVMLFLSLFGSLNIPQVPTPTDPRQYILYLFIIAISAGICEEIFFRGFLLRSFEGVSYKFAILFTAILFGIFHFNIYNLGATVLFGVVFGYLVLVTDSIWAGIIGHIFNNAFAVSLGFAVNRINEIGQEWIEDLDGLAESGGIEIINTTEIVFAVLIFGFISLGTGFAGLFTTEIVFAVLIFGFISLGTGFAGLLLLKRFRKPVKYEERHAMIFSSEQKTDKDDSIREGSTLFKDLWPIYPVIGIFIFFVGYQFYEIIKSGV